MKIAILISGRAKIYNDFLKMLDKCHEHELHIFISINDVQSEFYNILTTDFKKYLRGFVCTPYILPDNFYNCHKGTNILPYINAMSSFYNDKRAFDMACKYADENSFEYDIYLRTRTDIFINSEQLPEFDSRYKEGILFCVEPAFKPRLYYTENPESERKDGEFHAYGNIKHHKIKATSDIAYGNRKAMSIYCGTYENMLIENERNNGNYFIWFEPCITTHLEDSGYPWEFFSYDYMYIEGRR
jgi:hypothetical protein